MKEKNTTESNTANVTNIEINNHIEVNQYVTGQNNVFSVNELVPMQRGVDDSMEKIADITDEFSQTMEPILRMYNAAMCVTTARLDIIKDEFKFRKQRCPIHHIDSAVCGT